MADMLTIIGIMGASLRFCYSQTLETSNQALTVGSLFTGLKPRILAQISFLNLSFSRS